MTDTSPIIRLQGLCKSFGSTDVLHDIDLDIRARELITILGPSGCGKTTLLRLIAGFETPCSGSILIDGNNMDGVPPDRRRVNTVFQSYALFPHMTVAENVAFGLKMKRVPPEGIRERVGAMLRMVGMEELAGRRPGQLSGGQQQRVAIARAAVNNPLVLLLDEPLSALDAKLRKQMQRELRHLQKRLGITFVYVTHDQQEALSLSDRIVVMMEGRIGQVGTPADIYETPANLKVAYFVGETNLFSAVVAEGASAPGTVLAKVESTPTPLALRSKATFSPGQRVMVVLRPEDLFVVREPSEIDSGPALAGRVEETIYKGTTYDITVSLDIGRQVLVTEFFNEESETVAFMPGDRVYVSWVQGWELVLPDEEHEPI